MKREQIYLEGNEKIISEVLEIARSNLGKGINGVNLMPCIEKGEVIKNLKEILENDCAIEEDLETYISELEELK